MAKSHTLDQIKELPISFYGRGAETGGRLFVQVKATERGYIYKVSYTNLQADPYYEVFERKINQFGGVSYPRSKSFGKWAWTYFSLDLALEKLKQL